MNTAKHTPGPWVVSAGRVITTSSGQFYLTYGKDKHGNPLFKDFVELDNNTHLIAAAPAMYEALVETMRVLRSLRDNKEEWYTLVTPELLTAWDKNKAALAQADGEGILP
jgi:hypothetical protein